ncbi:MAG: GDSL-type esterase/lipase family protein, partial [Holophagales bacterium]|nr:GDSL-type esterase/lipase family protein [Holophagales bacterium]
MIRNLLLLFVSLLLSVALAEAAVRMLGEWSTDTSAGRSFYTRSWLPGVPYLMRPGLVETWGLGTVRAGPLGLRDSRPLPVRAGETPSRGELRVLVVGDSIVEGYGVDQEETLPRRLEHHLGERLRAAGDGRTVRVVNAGIAGLNAGDEAALLEAILPQVRPDLVVWFLIYNDYDDPLRLDGSGAIDSSPSYRLAIVPFLWHVWGIRRGFLHPGGAR